jgi:hypothetical protein
MAAVNAELFGPCSRLWKLLLAQLDDPPAAGLDTNPVSKAYFRIYFKRHVILLTDNLENISPH